MAEPQGKARPRVVGRYELHGAIASGGMATVYLGRIISDAGFSRTVAIKRLHEHVAKDPTFANMFIDEARLAASIHHPNVVSTLDVVFTAGELFVVMEYVQGQSLSQLVSLTLAKNSRIPVEFVCTIVSGVLHGLHAAHEAVNEADEPLGIVHRDVSPQNILVGIDGIPRLIDFGVAKATVRVQTTREGQLKGKLGYMPPEQFEGRPADRRGDIYSAAIVLWETLAGRRLFDGQTEAEILSKILRGPTEAPSAHSPEAPRALDRIVMRGLARDPSLRFATARQMALAIEDAVIQAPTHRVGEWTQSLAAESLGKRTKLLGEIESHALSGITVSAGARGVEAQGQPLQPPVETESRDSGQPADGEADTLQVGPEALDRPTPVNPIAPAAASALLSLAKASAPPPPSSTPPPPAPTSGPAKEPPAGSTLVTPTGAPWSESWDGVGWNVVRRPVSPKIVVLFGLIVSALVCWMLVQWESFGIQGRMLTSAAGAALLFAMWRMARSTYFRIAPDEVLIEQRPTGASTAITTHDIQRFLMIDEGPGQDARAFSVYFLPVDGSPQRLDVDFDSDAEARYAMGRFNEMLTQVRGLTPSRRPTS